MKVTVPFEMFLLTLLSSYSVAAQDYRQITTTPAPIVVRQELNFPCWYCLAIDSQGGGRFGATSSIFDLHVISSKYDVSFPRALVARIELECPDCQPTALTAQARGLSPSSSVFGANFEAYSQGRATVAEFNIGAANGGYVLDVVPVRLPDGSASVVDSVLKVEGRNGDFGAAEIGSYIDARVNPSKALFILPADQGPVTVFETSDGRMREVWTKGTAGVWRRDVLVDGASQDADSRITFLEARITVLTRALERSGLVP